MHLMDTLALLSAALITAKLLGGLGEKIGIPTVLSELFTGVLLGNFAYLAGGSFASLETSEVIHSLSEIGVLVLLFLVGLETNIEEMKRVGTDAFLVAVAGVVAPFALAFAVLPLVSPSASVTRTLFVAAALTATSVGVTARVLKDSGKLSSLSGRVILGAAVIDDVLGIVVLAAISSIVTRGSVTFGEMGWLALKILGFAVGVFVLRRFFLKSALRGFQSFEVAGTVTIIALSLCFLCGWGAEKMGLAGIVGAFAIGIALDDVQFRGFRTKTTSLDEILKPIAEFLTPVFFVLMGLKVKLSALFQAEALQLTLVLVICALAGKLVCGLAVRPRTVRQGADRLLIGFGMVPRGEVGFIFATMGLQLRVLSQSDYASVVAMVGITTLLAPLLIYWRASPKRA